MSTLAIIANVGTTFALTALLVAGWQYGRQLLEKRRQARADRPSENVLQVHCENCGGEYPVDFHTHELKQGRTVVGVVVHASKADVELHVLTCKGRG